MPSDSFPHNSVLFHCSHVSSKLQAPCWDTQYSVTCFLPSSGAILDFNTLLSLARAQLIVLFYKYHWACQQCGCTLLLSSISFQIHASPHTWQVFKCFAWNTSHICSVPTVPPVPSIHFSAATRMDWMELVTSDFSHQCLCCSIWPWC